MPGARTNSTNDLQEFDRYTGVELHASLYQVSQLLGRHALAHQERAESTRVTLVILGNVDTNDEHLGVAGIALEHERRRL